MWNGMIFSKKIAVPFSAMNSEVVSETDFIYKYSNTALKKKNNGRLFPFFVLGAGAPLFKSGWCFACSCWMLAAFIALLAM